MNITQLWIYLNAIFYAGLGVFTFIKPQAMAAKMGYELLNTTSIAELKAAYGGLLIALGVMMFLASIKLPLHICLAFIGLIYLGYASGRLTGVLLDGAHDQTTLMFLSIELSCLAITALLYYRNS